MKSILFLLMMGFSVLHSAPLALYEMSDETDSSGNSYDLTNNGSVQFVASPDPCNGAAMAGGFSDATYFEAPSGLRSALADASVFTFQFYVYLTNTANSPVAMAINDSGAPFFFQFNQNINPRVRWANEGTPMDVTHSTSIYNLNECVHFAFVATGSASEIYMNGNLLKSEATNRPIVGTPSAMRIGRFINSTGFFVRGYIDLFRIDLEALDPPFPTLPTATPTVTLTFTPEASPTFTPTPTWTPTVTRTYTQTSTPTPTFTATPTFTQTFTPTWTPTATMTSTPACSTVGETTRFQRSLDMTGLAFYEFVTTAQAGRFQTISCRIYSGSGNLKAAVYSIMSPNFGKRIDQSAVQVASVGLNTITMNIVPVSAGNYALAVEGSGSLKISGTERGTARQKRVAFGTFNEFTTFDPLGWNLEIYSSFCTP